MNPIIFNLGEESHAKIESLKEMENSLFREQYIKAFKEIKEYVYYKPDQDGYDLEHRNNIFAFIGERGSGKTSCMMSVAKMLIETKPDELSLYPDGFYIKDINKRFEQIDLIDPSFFDSKNNILNIVVAKLFKKFSDSVKGTNHNSSASKKQILLDKFQRTKENLNILFNNNDLTEDSLEQLVNLSAAVDLKINVGELIDAYLDYISDSKSFLIIKLDDIDLHTQHAHDMVEQIRKYLVHPKVIILMAVKLDQLAMVKKMHFSDEFKTLLNKDKIGFETIDEMVDRYLIKLIPLSNRLYLPIAKVYYDKPLIIKSEKKDDIVYNSIREAIPSLIFKKTRFLFYNTKGTTSYIIPRSLRELRHIIKLLADMQDYLQNGRPEYNKTIFKNYLFETWTNSNIDTDKILFINTIQSESDPIKINKSVIKYISKAYIEIINQIDGVTRGPYSDYYYILRDNTQMYNISLGDVMALISYLESVLTNELDHKFLFILKTIYSIKLYEYYDQLTEDKVEEPPITNIEEVFRNEFMKEYSNYDKLIGGNFINSGLIDIIPRNESADISRVQRNINATVLFDIIEQLKTSSSETVEIEGIKIDRSTALQIVEFFALTVSRKYDSKNLATDKSYRSLHEVYYGANLSDQKQNLYFDIVSIFFNITNIKRAYYRISSNSKRRNNILYRLAEKDDNSLLNTLRKKAKLRFELEDDKTEIIDNRLLSWVCIRNIEILEAFMIDLQEKKPGGSVSDMLVYRAFVNAVCRFKIETYDIDNTIEKHYDVDFSYLSVILGILIESNNQIFDLIFNSKSKEFELSNKTAPKSNKVIIKLNLRGNKPISKQDLLKKLLAKNTHLNESDLKGTFNSMFTEEIYQLDIAKEKLVILKNKWEDNG